MMSDLSARRRVSPWFPGLGLLLFVAVAVSRAADGEAVARLPLPVATLHRAAPVDFEQDVLPVFRRNCLACHNQSRAKGDLNLETPETTRRGGSTGPGLVPGGGAESLVFRAAAHQIDDLIMPPVGNQANAAPLKPEELAVLKAWIDEGARGEIHAPRTVSWSDLPSGWSPSYAVALSPDGRFVAGSRANQVEIYELATRRKVAQLADPRESDAAHRDVVNALAFSPDGEWIASAGFREVKLWRRRAAGLERDEAEAPIRELPGARPNAVNEQPSVSGSTGVTVVARGRVGPDRTLEYRVGSDGSVKVVTAGAEIVVLELPAGTPAVRGVVSEDLRCLAVVGVDGVIRLWRGDQDLRPLGEGSGDRELDLAVGRADQALAFVKAEAAFYAGAVQRGQEMVRQARETLDKAIARLAGHEKVLADRCAEWETRRAAAESETEKGKADPAATQAIAEFEASLKKAETAVAIATHDVALARREAEEAGRGEAEARAARAAQEAAIPGVALALDGARAEAARHATSPVTCMAFSPNGSILVLARASGRVQAWDVETLGQRASWTAEGGTVSAVSVSNDGVVRVVTVEAEVRRGLTPAWELAGILGGESVPPGRGFQDRVNALAFRNDGRALLTGGGEPARGGELKLWSVPEGTLLMDLGAVHSDAILAVAWSPDGRSVLSGGADRFMRWVDLTGGVGRRHFEGHAHHVMGVAWLRDGRTVASAGAEGVVKLWDPRTGNRLKNVEGFGKEVVAVQALGMADSWIAASASGLVRVFKSSGETVRGIDLQGAFLHALAVTPDGRLAAAGDADGTLRVWSVEDGRLLAEWRASK